MNLDWAQLRYFVGLYKNGQLSQAQICEIPPEDLQYLLVYAIRGKSDAYTHLCLFDDRLKKLGVDKPVDECRALFWAVNHSNISLTKELISRGADVNALNGEGQTALIVAENILIQRILLDAGANPNIFSDTSALGQSMTRNSIECVKNLLDAGADVNLSRFNIHYTSLQIAIVYEHMDYVHLLLERADLAQLTLYKEQIIEKIDHNPVSFQKSLALLNTFELHLKLDNALDNKSSRKTAKI